jgi:ubiquitin C-terminal hydrolase
MSLMLEDLSQSEATKQLLIHTLPNILVLQLKRFSFTGIGGEKVARCY